MILLADFWIVQAGCPVTVAHGVVAQRPGCAILLLWPFLLILCLQRSVAASRN